MKELGKMVFGNDNEMEFDVDRTESMYLDLEKLCLTINPKLDVSWRLYPEDFENDTFIIRQYDRSGESELPNFEYKPDGLKIEWYKYPFRSSTSNKLITDEYFHSIIEKCIESLQSKSDKQC